MASLASGSIKQLVSEQLAAVEQVLLVSGELVRRLEEETGEELSSVANAIKGARSAVQRSNVGLPPPGSPVKIGAITAGPTDLSAPLLPDRDKKKEKDGKGPLTLFPDMDEMKAEMRKTLTEGDTEVEELYHTTGCAQALAKNDTFKNMTFVVIFISSIWIAVDTDLNKPGASEDWKITFLWMDNFICTYFFVEISARFFAFVRKCDAFTQGSFNFDLALVLLMCFDTWFMPIMAYFSGGENSGSSGLASFRVLRLLRILRLARLGRLVRACPDLVVLVRGMMMAMRAVFSTVFLLVLIIYVFSILFVQMLSGSDVASGNFENIPQAMSCLLLSGVFADQQDFLNQLATVDVLYYFVMIVYLFLTCLTVLNMLIGLVCEVISQAAQAEAEERIFVGVRQKVREALKIIDANNDEKISQMEFANLLRMPDVVKLLNEVEVDVFALVECGEFIFHRRPELTFDEFMEEVVKFRGGNNATVKDCVDMRMFVNNKLMDLEDRMKQVLLKASLGAKP